MTDITAGQALVVAKEAALAAGEIQKSYRGKSIRVEHKGATDLVTEVDLKCEAAVIEVIRRSFPDHGILAEEEGASNADSPFRWIIDPLDGTTNYAHGFPVYCASVGFAVNGVPLAGAVYDPTRDELFTAAKGGGAFLNDVPLKISATDKLIDALIATGFPYQIAEQEKTNLEEFGRFAMKCQALRRPGAAALDLCYVAAGRLDGFWEFHLHAWDFCAAALVVREAGGRVTHTDNAPLDISRRDIVASNGFLHPAMISLLEV